MATTTVTVDTELLTATSIEAAKEARDLQFLDTPFLNELDRVHGKGKPNKTSGHTWVGGFNVGDHSSPTRMRTGFEQLNLSFASVLEPMKITPGEICYPVGISKTEEDNNGGALQTLNMASERVEAVMGQAKRDFEQHMLIGGVAGFEDFYSLNGLDYADGFLEGTAPSGQSNVIGGFSKATYAALPGSQNQVFDVANNFNALGNIGIDRVIFAAKPRTGTRTNMAAICSQKFMENYKRTLLPNERYASSENLDAHNLELYINGVKGMISPILGSYTPVSSSDVVSMMLLDLNEIYFMWSNITRDGYFGFSNWEDIRNGYNVRVAEILVRGQTWVKGWASSGVILNAEQY